MSLFRKVEFVIYIGSALALVLFVAMLMTLDPDPPYSGYLDVSVLPADQQPHETPDPDPCGTSVSSTQLRTHTLLARGE